MIKEKTILKLLNRNKKLFFLDFKQNEAHIEKSIKNSKIIVVGGAGSIGFCVIKLLISYKPKLIHIVDINENKLVEKLKSLKINLRNMCKIYLISIYSGHGF